MGSILATVAICTRNRVKYLGPTIEAVLAQECPRGSFEVLVIDNGSTDGTYEMVTSRFGKGTEVPVRCIREEVAGLSRARNRAITETKGEFILFLDDDAIPAANWLRWLCAAYAHDPRYAAGGGAIQPVFEIPPPVWFGSICEGIFTPRGEATELTRVIFPDYPYGANFTVRAGIARQVGGFNSVLGYKGDSLIPHEETELFLRIERAGFDVFYEPRAVVRHLISASRIQKSYLRRRFYFQGRGDAILKQLQSPGAGLEASLARLATKYSSAWLRYLWMITRYWLKAKTADFNLECLRLRQIGFAEKELCDAFRRRVGCARGECF